MRRLALFVVLLCLAAAASPAAALDRNAFAFTRYDLHVTVDPHQHALSAEGTVELRNLSATPQSEAALQISSSLLWRSIAVEGEPAEWLSESYTSDLDHTGALSEAIVKLGKPVAPGSSVRLTVRYSGTVEKDATRLERLGTPGKIALRSDWDQIGDEFTALRGAGYVAWYPLSVEAANLSNGNELFELLNGWREREHTAAFHLRLERSLAAEDAEADALFVTNGHETPAKGGLAVDFTGVDPVIVLLDEAASTLDRPQVAAYYTAAHTSFARDAITSIEATIPVLAEWFGQPHRKVVVVELTDPNALPYDTGSFFFTPLRAVAPAAAEVALARPVVRAMIDSPRLWIREGLATFAQALLRERQAGRHAALAYLGQFSSALAVAESASHPAASATTEKAAPDSAPQPLITTTDEIYYRTKAAYVWWMLRDLAGDTTLQKAIAQYRPEEDRDSGYLPRLITHNLATPRDLEPFFDDWVYRDRGLPQLRVESAYVRQTLGEQTVTAVTIENLGEAWCEVPVAVSAKAGENSARIVVPGHGKTTIRVSFESAPEVAEVNDGSVPESEYRDNRIPVTTSPRPAVEEKH